MTARRVPSSLLASSRELSWSRVAALACALSLTVAVLAAGPAGAAPPLTVADAKAQVSALQVQAEAIGQQYDAVQQKLSDGRQKLAQMQAAVRAQTAKVAALRLQVGQAALAQFQNRTVDTTAQLFLTADTDSFLNQMSTVQKVTQNQNSALQDFQAEQGALAQLQRAAQDQVATLAEDSTQLAALRADSEAKIAGAEAVLSRLTAQERARIAAEQAAQAKAAAQAAAKAAAQAAAKAAGGTTSEKTATTQGHGTKSPSGQHTSGSQSSSSSTVQTVSGSSKGAIALAWAKQQIGKPYRFAAAGPDAFDCSGLTMGAYRAAGISLPHSSQQQFGVGQAVSKSQLQPGDLVFFYSGVSHVGLYAGNGMVLHAPHYGATVGYIKMSEMPYVGARRPG